MAITAALVKELRERTGAGMMECKKALVETSGDIEAAIEMMRKSGQAKAAKKAGRTAAEGVVVIKHGDGGAAMVEVNCETDFVAKTPEFQALVKDLAMHVAAASPSAAVFVTKEEVPAEALEKEREIYRAQAIDQGKPEKVVERIAEGKLKEYYQSFVLLEQPFVKDPKLTVGQLIQEKIAVIKENIVVRRFARFRVGEAGGDAQTAAE